MKEPIDTLDQHEEFDQMGEAHAGSSELTPIRSDAFELSDDEKIKQIEHHYAKIMDILGLDLTDDSLKGTPRRVAKMYVKEVFNGLNPANRPEARTFNNNYDYSDVVIEKNIQVNSFCEHHFLPFIGKAHVAYIPQGKVIGLSKVARIVDMYARRLQIQENMTKEIAEALQSVTGALGVGVVIEAQHMCMMMRGVEKQNAMMKTSMMLGTFRSNPATRAEFLALVN